MKKTCITATLRLCFSFYISKKRNKHFQLNKMLNEILKLFYAELFEI